MSVLIYVALASIVLLALALQRWVGRLACYVGAALVLVWAAPMASETARLFTTERSDEALLLFFCLLLLGVTVLVGIREIWSWVRHGLPSDAD